MQPSIGQATLPLSSVTVDPCIHIPHEPSWPVMGIPLLFYLLPKCPNARCIGSDGSMSASGSADPGFDPRRGSKFSFENFQPRD